MRASALAQQVLLYLLVMFDLRHEEVIICAQQQPAILLEQLEAAITPDIIAHVVKDIAGHVVLAVLVENVDHLLGTHPGSTGIPERKRGQTIRMNMFRAFDEFAEGSQLVTTLGITRIVDFQQSSTVGLNNKRVLRIISHTN